MGAENSIGFSPERIQPSFELCCRGGASKERRNQMRGAIRALLLVMTLALHASARKTYPGGIQDAGNIPCTPTCLLCHTEIPGTLANLRQPFGLTVLGNGIQPGDPSSLHTVVANLREKKVDTDGDGRIDVDELAAGTNPSDPDPNVEICGPTYGCGAHLAPSPRPERAPILCWLAGILGLAALVGARRLRRAP
jgi:hypothetical protein